MQPIIELKSELEGIIKLEIIKPDGTLKEAEGLNIPFYNLITDAGLDYISENISMNATSNYCQVGTSSTPPTISDTSLGAVTGGAASGTSLNTVQYTTEPYYSEHLKVYTFPVGSVIGNLTEIGFFFSRGTMWSRALIKDSSGNPTTLTLLATEQLKVTYTIRRYIPTSLTGSFVLSTNGVNSTINYTITPANLSEPNNPFKDGYCSHRTMYIFPLETNTLGGVTSYPSGTTSWISYARLPYTAGSFQSVFTPTLGTGDSNFTTGIGSMCFWCGSSVSVIYSGYQCSFSPKIMKTSSQTLAIGIKLSWGRTTQQ